MTFNEFCARSILCFCVNLKFGLKGIAVSVISGPDVMSPVMVLGIAKVLMMHFPLPQRMDVILMDLKQNLEEFTGDLEAELRKDHRYDFPGAGNGYFFVKPAKLAKRLTIYERQMMVRRKLEFLLKNIHGDLISMEDTNRDKFFKHFIGWRQTEDDVKVWLSVLEQTTKRYFGDLKPLRHILSFREMMICALNSIVSMLSIYFHRVLGIDCCSVTGKILGDGEPQTMSRSNVLEEIWFDFGL